jgi:uridine phosphorylase
MDEMVIEPRREKSEETVPPPGLLLINPVEMTRVERLLGEMGAERRFLFNSRLFVLATTPAAGPCFVAGPSVGAPMAVLTLEKLIALGARRILVYGWCGSLQRDLALGDLLLPSWAISEEGTSGHYPLVGRPESSESLRHGVAAYLAAQGFSLSSGPLWTTDAPYRESRAKVEQYGEDDIRGVDMEFAALCTVAAFRGVELAAVLKVSDLLWRSPWRPGYKDKQFKQQSEAVVRSLIDYCRNGAS